MVPTLNSGAARAWRAWGPGQARFWRAYGVTLRPYLMFVSGAAGLVGLALAPPAAPAGFVAATVAFGLAYGLGQALTDVSQVDTDALSSPYRPLVRGEIGRRDVAVVSLAGLGGCGATFAALNPWTLVPAWLAVLGLASYTHFKRRWWGGPPWNAAIVALLPLIGVACGERSPRAVLAVRGLAPAMASVFFSYAVFVLLGYFKDLAADRATGYRTLPVRFGWRAAVWTSAVSAAAAVAASVALLRSAPRDQAGAAAALAAGLWLGGATLLLLSHPWMLRIRDERRAHGPIALCVRGCVLLHLGEAALLRPWLAAPAAAAYALFEWCLASRPERTQI